MIDSVEHVDFIAREVPGHEGLRVAIDVDASLRVGPAHLGVRRSPTRTPARRRGGHPARPGARARRRGPHVLRRPDRRAARLVARRAPDEEGLRRRAAHPPGRGRRGRARRSPISSSSTAAAPAACTSPTSTRRSPSSLPGRGSSHRRSSTATTRSSLRPAAYFAAPVVRRPGEGMVTAYGGGYVASGPPGWSRVPSPLPEQDLALRPAGGRRRGADAPRGRRGRPARHWVIGYGSGTPRRGSWPSASRSSRSSAATEATGSSDGPRPIVGKGSALADSVGGVTRRVVRSIDWSNWAGTESSKLARVATPRSEAEVVEEVAASRRPGPAGQGDRRRPLVHRRRRDRRGAAAPRRPERGHLDRLDARRGDGARRHPAARAQRGARGLRLRAAQPRRHRPAESRRRHRHRHARHRAAPHGPVRGHPGAAHRPRRRVGRRVLADARARALPGRPARARRSRHRHRDHRRRRARLPAPRRRAPGVR